MLMDEKIVTEVLTRLDDDAAVVGDAKDLVYAALVGQLDEFLTTGDEVSWEPGPGQTHASQRSFVKSIGVEGFRGIGPAVRLKLTPRPGLTLVVGANGSGKSSFAEALDLALTRDVPRWARGRSGDWKAGWKNLHHEGEVAIDAELMLENRQGPVTSGCTWADAAALDEAAFHLSVPGQTEGTGTDLSWEEPLAMFRPFLAYDELASMLEQGPSSLYDALASILGLDDLARASDELKRIRLEMAKAHKETKASLPGLREQLEHVQDERASRCSAALAGRKWDLALVETLTTPETGALAPEDTESELGTLRLLAAIVAPDPEEVERLATELRSAHAAAAATIGTDADRARLLADTLKAALGLHEHTGGGDCPVCGQASGIGADWRTRAESEVRRLEQEAGAAAQARASLERAVKSATAQLSDAPAVLARATAVGVETTALCYAWAQWGEIRGASDVELATRIEQCCGPLDDAAGALRKSAYEQLALREDTWRPVATALREWTVKAGRMLAEADTITSLKAAEDWLRDMTTTLRNERFAPVESRVKELWDLLRAGSSIDLHAISFSGRATRRRIDLGVRVDGNEAVALGVMSQGELTSLALCLFLARATLAASPFRFVIVDDPVQAMDTDKIDGLARVLATVARERQVVVFTHDDRLLQAVRRLGIEASSVGVVRGERSVVDLQYDRTPETEQ